jgi:hypothetical protein
MFFKTTFIDRWLERLHPRKSFKQLLAEMLANEEALIALTKASIERQKFDLHMSEKRVQALNEWLDGNPHLRKELPQ